MSTRGNEQNTNDKMVSLISPRLLNAKVVNTPTKRQRLSGWVKK